MILANDIPDRHPPSSRRRGIMLCQPFDEARLAKWDATYLVQPKLDGERCRAVCDGNTWSLWSSEMNEFMSVPHINIALQEQLGLPACAELDGELYYHGTDFSDIHSVVGRSVNLHDNHMQMQYHIFDLVNTHIQLARLIRLRELILRPPLIKVPFHVVHSLDEILRHLQKRHGEEGYEGIIVRHAAAPYERKRSLWVMKYKPRKSDYYIIIGTKEEVDKHGNPKDRLGALICTSNEGTTFSVGSGFTAEARAQLWAVRSTLPGKLVHVLYQSVSTEHVPRFPIYSEILDL